MESILPRMMFVLYLMFDFFQDTSLQNEIADIFCRAQLDPSHSLIPMAVFFFLLLHVPSSC